MPEFDIFKEAGKPPAVTNLKDAVRHAVRVDRHTPWGNPFLIGPDGDRDQVCDLFAVYAKWRLTIQPDWLKPLIGKHLACHCHPKRCHAETLLELANQTTGEKK